MKKSACLPIALLSLLSQLPPAFSQSQPTTRTDFSPAQQPESSIRRGRSAAEAAADLRRVLPVLPSLVRGMDGMLSTHGQRATQNQLVTSTNVKDPAIDSFPFGGSLLVEAGEPVQIPAEQFTVTLPKFYAAVPTLDPISSSGWHFSVGTPFFSLRHVNDATGGIRSLAPNASATGPLIGGLSLFQSFGYRLSKTTVERVSGGSHDSEYTSHDSNTHIDVKSLPRHQVTARLALFSQDMNFATLNALSAPEATPDYLMRGGQLFFSDSFTSRGGTIIDSSFGVRKLRLRVSPRGDEPMVLVEQGQTFGNYFDHVRRDSSRIEWREAVRLSEMTGWGKHRISFGGGMAHSAFDSFRLGNKIILMSDEGSHGDEHGEEDEGEPSAQTGDENEEGQEETGAVFSVTTFAGSPFESRSMNEFTGWLEDRWAPVRRVTVTLGFKYDRSTISRQNQWAPRVGFALLPFNNDRTVIRGGAGIFYDIIPLTVGTFTTSRQRVVQFFEEGEEVSEPTIIANRLSKAHLRTPHALGWNLELDQEIGGRLFVRIRAEERRGRDLTLLDPDRGGTAVTEFTLSDGGTSRFRDLEATTTFRPRKATTINASYTRSSSMGDLNTFTSTMGTFEKLAIGRNQYAHSRSDAPHRFLLWGDLQLPGGFTILPALDVHTGFPFGFTDADNKIPGKADFGRFPRTVSFDLALNRDFALKAFDRQTRLRLGVRIYNLSNHFNPRDVELADIHTETEDVPILRGFLNGAGRTYRASLMLEF